MTTRRIIFPMPSGVGFWISPMQIGDKTELLEAAAPYSCDLDWAELKGIFQGVQNTQAFEVACAVAQLTFTSSDGDRSSKPSVFQLSLDDIRCDELYRIEHGEVKRVHALLPAVSLQSAEVGQDAERVRCIMTIKELLDKFALESEMQINVITEAGTLVYIPDVRYFREHLHFKTMKEVAALPVTSIMVSLEEGEDGPILLLVINEKTEEQEMMHS